MVCANMIPINQFQSVIYKTLNDNLDIAVYDEVLESAIMPLLTIGDYTLSEYNTKYEGYEFNWKLSIYTEYEGKKEVNNLLSKTLMILQGLDSSRIDNFYIDSVWLDNANVFRNEGYYIADINIKFLIMEV